VESGKSGEWEEWRVEKSGEWEEWEEV